MKPLSSAAPGQFKGVRYLLTDMDETLTFQGRLAAETYAALERLQASGIVVIPVTAAPAGWCDQMARMWPVDAVIGENGGLWIERDGEGARRAFWSDDPHADRRALEAVALAVRERLPKAHLADDQDFRLASLAFRAMHDPAFNHAVEALLAEFGLKTTRNNLWVLGWIGAFDKLAAARGVLAERFGLDIDEASQAVAYVGDSANDGPMFSFFSHTFGVSTVIDHLDALPTPPAWISEGPGGAGFVEVVEAILRDRSAS